MMKKIIITVVIIIVTMLSLGVVISIEIQDYLNNLYAQYDNALIIEDENSFREGINKSKGYAFAYGTLKSLDPVSVPELSGEYSYLRIEEQKYQKNTRTVVKSTVDADGNPSNKIVSESYWSWDTVNTKNKYSKSISFLNVEFDYGQIPFPGSKKIKTVEIEKNLRIVYYGTESEVKGTLYTNMTDETIKDSVLYENKTIEETINNLESGQEIVIFWIFWGITLLFIVIFVVIISH